MPSKEFMKSVLESPAAQVARGELPVEADEGPGQIEEEQEVEAPQEEEEQEQPSEGEQEVAEEEGGVPEEDAGDEQGEAEAESESGEEGEQGEPELIFGRYHTMEDAERGFEETRRFARERAQAYDQEKRQREQLERQLAEAQGYIRGRDLGGEGGDFEQWADGWIETNPEQGMHQAIRASIDSQDQSYAYAYTDRWKETDPYSAAVWRNRLETAIFQTSAPAEEIDQTALTQEVWEQTWLDMAEDYPEMRDDDFAKGMAATIRGTERLRLAALTGDPERVRDAFEAGRALHKATHNSGPKRVRRVDAEAVERDKRAATVTNGDGAPARRNAKAQITPEEEMILAGAEKLGLRRRDE